MDRTGVIYMLTNPSFLKYTKIGYADDIEKRLSSSNGVRVICLPSTSMQPMLNH
jgi:hypothetical protein